MDSTVLRKEITAICLGLLQLPPLTDWNFSPKGLILPSSETAIVGLTHSQALPIMSNAAKGVAPRGNDPTGAS